MKTIILPVILALAAFTVQTSSGAEEAMPKSVLEYKMDGIDGKPYDLTKHKGEVILLVNVASQCGLTPQYKDLEALYEKYKDKGLTIIGIPANEFGHQEPGTNEEIKKFCSSKYSVTFPMLAKVVVKGEGICPLYKYLTTESPKPGEIKWNFNKFLIDRKGAVIDRFEPQVKPDDAKLVGAVEKALADKPEK